MATAIIRDIEQMIIKLLIVGPLMRSLQGGLGDLFGGVTSAGGIAGAVGPTSVGGAPLVPAFAGGTDFAPGGLSLVGERGPELVNLPRGSQVIPNIALRNSGAEGGVTVNMIEDSSRAGQVDKRDNGAGGFDLNVYVDSITAKNAANPGSATSRVLDTRKALARR
jgi:hypothetical protein